MQTNRSRWIKWTELFFVMLLLAACSSGGGSQSASDSGGSSDKLRSDGTWTQVSGATTADQLGTYGTKSVPASSNMPGARFSSMSWTDGSGNLWLFGGGYFDSESKLHYLNDLWKFDRGSREWTWVSGSDTPDQWGTYGTKGTATVDNVPGGRYAAVSWIDGTGNLWLFGGTGFDASGNDDALNDLWKFDPVTRNWTWVSGSDTVGQMGTYGDKGVAAPTNVPGARDQAVSGIDANGIFWLFGGFGYDSSTFGGHLNDLWKFDPTSGNWTWVNGAKTGDQRGNYGTKGTADSANVPGGRDGAFFWIDSSGTLWLFGGYGLDSSPIGTPGPLNDLWKFDGTNWTWVSGGNLISQYGSYGSRGFSSASNVPGSRNGGVSWIDGNGSLWLFGGYGYASRPSGGALNDLWKFNPVSGEWIWVSGASSGNQSGSGTVPGSRMYTPASWIDANGNLWLFGGYGFDSAGTLGCLNDLWRAAVTTHWVWWAAPSVL